MTIKRPAIIFHAITMVCPRTYPSTITKKAIAIDLLWKCVDARFDSATDKQRRDSFGYEVMVSISEGCMARAEGWVNIATCSMYRWRGDLGVTFFPRYGQKFCALRQWSIWKQVGVGPWVGESRSQWAAGHGYWVDETSESPTTENGGWMWSSVCRKRAG